MTKRVQFTLTLCPSPVFPVISPMALMAITETGFPLLSKRISFFRTYVDLMAMRSPGCIDATCRAYRSWAGLSHCSISQIPSRRKRSVWSPAVS